MNQATNIYGLYQGSLNKEILKRINQISELDLWLLIYSAESEIFWRNNENRMFEIDQKEMEEAQYGLEYLIYQTKKFGVELNEPKEYEHIEKSDSFLSWYQYWREFVFSININVKNMILKLREKGEDISEYLPKSSWKETYEKRLKKDSQSYLR